MNIPATAKDFKGNLVQVGDIVIYMSSYYKSFKEGVVVKVNPKKVTIQRHDKSSWDTEQRGHSVIYKIGTTGVTEFSKFEVWSEDNRFKFGEMQLDARFDDKQAYDYLMSSRSIKPEVQVRKVK